MNAPIEPAPIADSHSDWHDWIGSYLVPAYGLRNWDDAQHLLFWLDDIDRKVEFSAWLDECRYSDAPPE